MSEFEHLARIFPLGRITMIIFYRTLLKSPRQFSPYFIQVYVPALARLFIIVPGI